MIKTQYISTFMCDLPDCAGGVGGSRAIVERAKPPGDPVLFPQGWTVLLWRNDAGTPQERDIHICGSCYSRLPRLLGLTKP